MRRSLTLLVHPLFSPRAGFRRFLAAHGDVDPASHPLFSLLLAHFGAALLYALILRREGPGAGDGTVPPDAGGALTAAIPFIGSLAILVAVLLIGALLWAAGLVFGRRRPLGEWVGLAALCALPEVARVLVVAVLTLAGETGVLAALPVDPFSLWTAVLMAFGFAAYADRPLWAGAAVAAVITGLQALLNLAA